MKNKCIALISLVVFMLFISCSTDDNESMILEDDVSFRLAERPEPKIVVFGRYSGRCEGINCVEIYQFNGNQLSEDITNVRPSRDDFFKGKFKHQVELDVRLNLPSIIEDIPLLALSSHKDNVFGNPGVYDQPVYYLEYQNENSRSFWIIDSDLRNIPKSLHSYVNLLDSMITVIQEEDTNY